MKIYVDIKKYLEIIPKIFHVVKDEYPGPIEPFVLILGYYWFICDNFHFLIVRFDVLANRNMRKWL